MKKKIAIILVIAIIMNILPGCATTEQKLSKYMNDGTEINKGQIQKDKYANKDIFRILGAVGGGIIGALVAVLIEVTIVIPVITENSRNHTEESLIPIFLSAISIFTVGAWVGAYGGYTLADALYGE